MLKITVIACLLALASANVEWQGQDVTNFYEGWFHAVGLKSSFTDKMDDIVYKASEEMKSLDLHKPVMSLLETGTNQESMSETVAMKVVDFMTPLTDSLEAIEQEAGAARATMGFSFGGLGLPRPDHPAAKALWNAIGGEEEEKKGLAAFSLLESSSTVEMTAQGQAGAKKMRSTQGKQLLQMSDSIAQSLEKNAQEAEEKMRAMMGKMMSMTMEERKPLFEEYNKLKKEAAFAKQAHEMIDEASDDIYKEMAKYPEEQMMDQDTVAFDNKVENEFEELLHDPKMQSMLQMADMTPSSFLETGTSAEAQQMLSVQVTAQGRVGLTGVDEEGTEDQGAAQAAELLKMFDVHVGHTGSAPTSLTSFIQTHDALSEQQREAAQAKALLQRRVSQAMSRSAQIDKLLDDAIMDYLSDPKEIEQKPSVIEEIAGAFRSNSDPLYVFSEHPFIVRYRNEQKSNAVMPPKAVQRQLVDKLLKSAPQNMKMAVIHANLDAPGVRELKIQQDLVCMKKALEMMKEPELRIFIDVQGGAAQTNKRVSQEIGRVIPQVHALKELGEQATQDYATGLADFVFRVGEGQLADSRNHNLAAFKVEALKRGGVVKADVSKAPADMCTLDNENLEVATMKMAKKSKHINKLVTKVEQHKKETKMLSETEQWAQQQRRVEHNHKHHGKATEFIDFKPQEIVSGFANFLHKGSKKAMQASLAQIHEKDRHETPKARRGPNYGLYKA